MLLRVHSLMPPRLRRSTLFLDDSVSITMTDPDPLRIGAMTART